jgi:excisionase family DNA binding protein
MPSTKAKSGERPANGPAVVTATPVPAEPAAVLTLTEAAAYLRIAEEDVLRMVRTQGLPGRDIGGEWRFLKAALQTWLSTPPVRKGLLSQIGALPDDSHREEMLRVIYGRRGRPEADPST